MLSKNQTIKDVRDSQKLPTKAIMMALYLELKFEFFQVLVGLGNL